MARNGYTEAEASSRIGSQMPLTEKARRAEYVIENSGDRQQLRQRSGGEGDPPAALFTSLHFSSLLRPPTYGLPRC